MSACVLRPFTYPIHQKTEKGRKGGERSRKGSTSRSWIFFLRQSVQLLNNDQMIKWWFTNAIKMLVKYGEILVNDGKCLSMIVKWVYDHTLISPSLTSISPSFRSILLILAWNIPSFANLTIIKKLHRL